MKRDKITCESEIGRPIGALIGERKSRPTRREKPLPEMTV